MKLLSVTLLLTLAAFNLPFFSTLSRAQGSLTPPGPPAATMKTLDQIESRTPIGTAPFTISQGGSYYLTANLTVATGNAITITADNVTLDLNGFTIKSTASPAQGAGIWLAGTAAAVGNRCISITNGTITGAVTLAGTVFSGSGFSNGVAYLETAYPQMVEATHLKVRGVSGSALALGSISRARDCVVRVAGALGIQATTVANCQAYDCGNSGIQCTTAESSVGQSVGHLSPMDGINAVTRATNCEGSATGNGRGVKTRTAIGCTGTSAISHGIFCDYLARDCNGHSVSGIGLEALYMATQCFGQSNNGTGLQAGDANTCTGVSSNSTGLKADNASQCYGDCGNNTPAVVVYALEIAGTASNCHGRRTGGIPIKANIAIGCTMSSASQKFLGTP